MATAKKENGGNGRIIVDPRDEKRRQRRLQEIGEIKRIDPADLKSSYGTPAGSGGCFGAL